MLNLLRKNYDNVTCAEFDSDLDEKDWVILTREPNSGDVMGFSTQQMYNQQSQQTLMAIMMPGKTWQMLGVHNGEHGKMLEPHRLLQKVHKF